MKPLFLTYLTPVEPYITFARKLEADIKRLDAGDFQLIKLNPPGNNANFYTMVACLLYPYISRSINLRPLIFLDPDNELKKPLEDYFEKDWDVAAVFRFPQLREFGRQDYCAGLIALNNKRPDIIRRFWIEWMYKTEFWEKIDSERAPKTLRDDGWKPCWFSDQGSLNEIILPDGNQGKPEEDSHKVVPGEVYETHGYRILPLERRIYGALPADSEDACIIHYKGKKKKVQ